MIRDDQSEQGMRVWGLRVDSAFANKQQLRDTLPTILFLYFSSTLFVVQRQENVLKINLKTCYPPSSNPRVLHNIQMNAYYSKKKSNGEVVKKERPIIGTLGDKNALPA